TLVAYKVHISVHTHGLPGACRPRHVRHKGPGSYSPVTINNPLLHIRQRVSPIITTHNIERAIISHETSCVPGRRKRCRSSPRPYRSVCVYCSVVHSRLLSGGRVLTPHHVDVPAHNCHTKIAAVYRQIIAQSVRSVAPCTTQISGVVDRGVPYCPGSVGARALAPHYIPETIISHCLHLRPYLATRQRSHGRPTASNGPVCIDISPLNIPKLGRASTRCVYPAAAYNVELAVVGYRRMVRPA